MFRPRTLIFALAAAAPLLAQDFGPAVKAAGLIYQGKNHFGVVCDYGRSRDQVAEFQKVLPEGSILTVVDARHPMQVGPAGVVIVQRGVQLLTLMPQDPLVRDGSPFATALVSQVATTIPAFGTRPEALKNGCAFAMGRATNWELVFNPKLLDLDLRKGVIEDVTVTPWTNGGKGATLDLVTEY